MNRWEFVPNSKPLARACPKCGAEPYNSCKRRMSPDSGGYIVKLKSFHVERRRRPQP